jgi:sulfate/thiosulfate transport system ATP-binding protein
MDITLRNVRKQFTATAPALAGIDLSVRSGELLALLGPSGSGKTTLLRTIAGLERPSSGSIFFGADDASHKTVQERRVGFVFQHYALFRHMTVEQNIGYGLRVRPRARRPSNDEIARRVRDLVELVQLSGLQRRFPAQLSGGQRQRVALARALAVEPQVLLLDEPFGALDAKVRRELRRWLRHIHDRTGHTTLFVTHDQEEALELADRVAILNAGRIEQIGTADEIYDHPASPFVFNFIGESTRLPVEVRGGRVMLGIAVLQLDPGGQADGPAELLLRPQDVTVVDGTQEGLAVSVVSVRRTDQARRAEVRLDDGGVLEVDFPAAAAVKVSDRARIAIRNGRLFAGASGRQ